MPRARRRSRCSSVGHLHPRATAAGVRLFAYEVVDSTNTEAFRRARAGERGPFWVTAHSQRAGRGRRGREWISEPGNLYASLLLDAPSLTHCAPQLSFVASLAVRDAICDVAGLAAQVKLKWPNDILCGGLKLGGILIEGELPFIVVGIGVNCAHHPDRTRYPSTDLSACGAPVSPEEVFQQLSARMCERLIQWNEGAGFASTRADWLQYAFRHGGNIRVSIGEGDVTGIFDTLDDTGRLVLRLPDGGQQAITAGEVLPLEPAVPDISGDAAFACDGRKPPDVPPSRGAA